MQAFKADAEARLADVPEKPDGYELPAVEGFQFDPANPLFQAVAPIAHELGLGKAAFQKLATAFAEAEVARAVADQKAEAEMVAALDAQLGPKAADRKAAAKTWLGAESPEVAGYLAPMLNVPVVLTWLEGKMRAATSGGMPGFNGIGRGGEGEKTLASRLFPKLG